MRVGLIVTLAVAAAAVYLNWTSPNIITRLTLFSGFANQPPKEKKTIRIGLLGASAIAPIAAIIPAQLHPSVEITAVAARSKSRAHEFAKKHGIPRVLATYDDIINDPEIDAIYNPLPNSLHFEWTIKAINAGKHVLLEKPFTSNAKEAQAIVDAVKEKNKNGGADTQGQRFKGDVIVIEAFHWRFHPLALRVREIMDSGVLGRIKSTNTTLTAPSIAFSDDDIRFNLTLSGGSMMDTGSYTISTSRWLSISEKDYSTKSEEQVEPIVTSAESETIFKNVDHTMRATLKYPNGVVSYLHSSLKTTLPGLFLYAEGELGSLYVYNFIAPSIYHYLTVTIKDKTTTEKVYGNGAPTYYYQLDGFVKAVRGEIKPSEYYKHGITSAEEAVRNMKVMDQVYEKSGLGIRGVQ
jgi:predicted dehydrogenase